MIDKKYKSGSQRKHITFKFVTYFILLVFLVISVFPLLLMWKVAFSPIDSAIIEPFSIPSRLVLENMKSAWIIGKMGSYMVNSIIVIIPRVAGILFLSAFAGYAFGKLRFPGRDGIFYFILFGMMIPIQAVMIPLFYNLRTLGLINSYWALIIPAIGMSMPFGIFFMRAFFRGLPDELIDSAKIDGANEFQTFIKIMLPLTTPALLSLLVFQAMWGWNDFLLPLLVVFDDRYRTLPIGLMYFKTRYTTNYAYVAAGVTISSLPIVLLYILFQRSFIKGVTAGAVKG